MVHDLVPLRFPEWVQARTKRMHGAKYRNAAHSCDVLFVNSVVHEGRGGRAARRRAGEGGGRLPGCGDRGRGASRRSRPPLPPHRGDARAAQEPRDAARRAATGRPRARRRRRGRLGAAAVARPPRRDPARLRGRRRARAPLPGRRRVRLPVAFRGVRHSDRRGDGGRRAGRRLRPPVDGRGRRRRRRACRPERPGGDRGRASRRRCAAATGSSRAGWRTRSASAGTRPAASCSRRSPHARRPRHLAARPDAGRARPATSERCSPTTSTSGSPGAGARDRRRSSAMPGGTRTVCRGRPAVSTSCTARRSAALYAAASRW